MLALCVELLKHFISLFVHEIEKVLMIPVTYQGKQFSV